jgi:hypothetical protein
VALLLLVLTLLVPGSASAAPAPDAGAAAPIRPVSIVVDRLDPKTITPESSIELRVILTNDGDETLTGLTLRLQRGPQLATRAALAADVADPSTSGTVSAPFQPVGGELEPGDSFPFTYTTSAAELRLTAAGVYPALVNVNGTSDTGLTQRVGEFATHLVVGSPEPQVRTSVAFLWPITDRPHRDATGTFADDDLTRSVADGGRLDRALATIEALPTTRPPGDGTATADVSVTLAVDPALVEELSIMATGSYSVRSSSGGTVAGGGRAEAEAFLGRLGEVATQHPIVALPYADADLDALQAVGGSDVVARTLPGTTAGTARATPAPDGDTAPPSVPATGAAPDSPDPDSPDPDGAAAPGGAAPEATGVGAGAQILRSALGVAPRTDLAWPADGVVRTDTLATLQGAGVDSLVLSEASVSEPDGAVASTGGTATSRVMADTDTGQLTTLVADPLLGDVLSDADTAVGGQRAAEQRFLAELAVITSQAERDAAAGGTATPTVLVVPRRLVDVSPVAASALMADTVQQPWLSTASLDQLAAGPTAAAGDLVTSTDTGQLAGSALREVADAIAVRDDFAAAVVDDPDTVLAPYDAAIARATATAWRTDTAGFAAVAGDLRATLDRLREQVSLVEPADGTYSLASSDAPLVLTVANDLPFAVQVRVRLETVANAGLTTPDGELQTLAPGLRTPLEVPVQVRQSGSFAVTATITTPDGGELGRPVQLQIKSTVYGTVTVAITIGAAALLALLFLRRLVLFVLRRRRGRGAPTGVDPAAGDPSMLPPSRSPV